MKFEIKETKPKFTPFNITLNVETEEDARALYAIFNYAPHHELFDTSVCSQLTRELGSMGNFYITSGNIANGVHAKDFYREKNRN